MPRQIRILMLLENSSFPEDSRVLLQARSLTSAGYHVTVVAPTEHGTTRKSEQIDGVQVYRYPHPPELGGILGYSLEYGYSIIMQWLITWYVFFRFGFDTIHMHTPPDMNAIIPAFFQLFGKTFVYDLHDLSPELFMAQRDGKGSRVLHRMLLFFERFASRMSNLSIATNESQRDMHVARCRVSSDKFQIVRNGPNEAFLNGHISAKPEVRSSGSLTLGYVGVMGIQDGVDYLIKAMDVLVNERQRKDVRAVLVGSGTAMNDLQELVVSKGLAPFITFTGRVPFAEVPAYIASFDICCTPDPSNPYNDSCTTIKTMEYMALGKPVVCFETTENMKTAGEAALYAKDNDLGQYVDLIEKLMNDQQLRQQMGQLGRKRALESLAWKHQACKLIQAYDRLHRVDRHENSPYLLDPKAKEPFPLHFAFNGALVPILKKYYDQDRKASTLSTSFRFYYWIRPLIPTGLRNIIQRARNSRMHVAENWYIPSTFIADLKTACPVDFHSKPADRPLIKTPEQHPDHELTIHPWPNGFRYAISLTHDIESQDGVKRVSALAELEEQLGLRSAWFFVPHKYKIDPGLIDDLKARGHEVGIHGYNHDGRLFVSRAIFQRRAQKINSAGQRYQASGFRSPMVHRNLDWMQQLEFNYDASCFDIDPFQPMPGGVGGVWPFIAGRLVELPYTLPQDHTLMITLNQPALEIWLKKLAFIRSLSGLAMLITHPDYLDSPERLGIYRQFCEHVAQTQDSWKALPNAIAQWWRLRHTSTIQDQHTIAGRAAPQGRVVPLQSLFEFDQS